MPPEALSTKTACKYKRPWQTKGHLIEPVGRRRELPPVEDHPDGEVGVVDVEVEGDAPHHDQPGVHVLDLPADGPASSSRRATLETHKSFAL